MCAAKHHVRLLSYAIPPHDCWFGGNFYLTVKSVKIRILGQYRPHVPGGVHKQPRVTRDPDIKFSSSQGNFWKKTFIPFDLSPKVKKSHKRRNSWRFLKYMKLRKKSGVSKPSDTWAKFLTKRNESTKWLIARQPCALNNKGFSNVSHGLLRDVMVVKLVNQNSGEDFWFSKYSK